MSEPRLDLAGSRPGRMAERVRASIQIFASEICFKPLVNGMEEAVVTFNRRDYLDADPVLASRGRTAVPVLAPGDAFRRLDRTPA